MRFKTNDKVVYVGTNDITWKLERYQTYTIDNRATNMTGEAIYYTISDTNGVHTNWYKEEDFISIVESRKLKLDKINNV